LYLWNVDILKTKTKETKILLLLKRTETIKFYLSFINDIVHYSITFVFQYPIARERPSLCVLCIVVTPNLPFENVKIINESLNTIFWHLYYKYLYCVTIIQLSYFNNKHCELSKNFKNSKVFFSINNKGNVHNHKIIIENSYLKYKNLNQTQFDKLYQ